MSYRRLGELFRPLGTILGKGLGGGGGDTEAPTVVITCDQSSPTAAGTLNYTITFSETVTGFELADFVITNGSKGALGGSGAVYTCAVTPTTAATPVTANVAAGVAQDGAGNPNTAAAELSIDYYSAIYYVRKTGNDTTGDGSTGNPWLTLVKALTVAGAGHLVRMGDGTYSENSGSGYLNINKNLANFLTVEAEDGALGSVTITNVSGTYGVLISSGTRSHMRFRWLTFTAVAATSQPVRILGTLDNYEFIHCTFTPSSSALYGIYITPSAISANLLFSYCTHNKPNDTTTFPAVQMNITATCNGVVFDNCTIHGSNYMSGGGGKGIYFPTGAAITGDITISNCTIDAAQPVNLVQGGVVTISNCTLTAEFEVILGVDGSPASQGGAQDTKFVIEDTVIVKNAAQIGHALLAGANCVDSIVDNVTIATAYDYGLVIKENTGTEVTGCNITGGSSSAVYMKAAVTANVHGNTFTGAGGAGAFQLAAGDSGHKCDTWQFQNNVVNVNSGKALQIGNDTDDLGGGICDYNTYEDNTGLGIVRNDANVENLAQLQAAWGDYDVTTNDANSTVV